MKKREKNYARGFGMIETIIALVMMGLAVLAGIQLQTTLRRGQRGITQSAEFEYYVSRVRVAVRNESNCASILPTEEPFPATIDATFLNEIGAERVLKFSDGNILVEPVSGVPSETQANEASRNTFIVKSFKFVHVEPLGTDTYQGTLRLVAERYPPGSSAGAQQFPPREVDVIITVDATTKTALSCRGVGEIRSTASTSGGLPCRVGQFQVGTSKGGSVCQPDPPCAEGQTLVVGVVKDTAGNPILDETGEPRLEWICAGSDPKDDTPDFLELCDGICF